MKVVFFIVLLLFAPFCFAETLENLDQKINAMDSQISSIEKKYRKLRVDSHNQNTTQAYASAESLNAMNLQLNQLKSRLDELCREWREVYRKTIDKLLAAADIEKVEGKKAQIGRDLQRYQERNSVLCRENMNSVVSNEWRSLRVEGFDGPREVEQKIQLLQDISRESMITLARLDDRHQDILREQKTKERAEELIQEGTLFNEGITVRRSSVNSGAPVTGAMSVLNHPPDELAERKASALNNTNEWTSGESDQQFEAQYQKRRAELLKQQKELQIKIEEFDQKARTFEIP